MELEKQVTNLELSKKLKELGYPQEGLFWWVSETLCINAKLDIPEIYICDGKSTMWENPDRLLGEFSTKNICVAPTVAELGEWLPDVSVELTVNSHKGEGAYWLDVWSEDKQIMIVGGEDTEANARAKMLIWLVENDYVSFK